MSTSLPESILKWHLNFTENEKRMSKYTNSPILFFPGANTRPTGDVHFGFMNLGPAHIHFQKAFHNIGRPFVVVPELNAKTHAQQVTTAIEFIEKIKNPTGWHFVGHSMGGIVAREVIGKLPESQRPASIVTIATPHQGAILSNWINGSFATDHPIVHGLLSRMGFRFKKCAEIVENLTVENMSKFNSEFPLPTGINVASVVVGGKHQDLNWPFSKMHKNIEKCYYNKIHTHVDNLLMEKNLSLEHLESDGMVECHSQEWGEIIDRRKLDHGNVIGLTTTAHLRKRKIDKIEFQNMVQRIHYYLVSCENDMTETMNSQKGAPNANWK
jgi:hypothetical protein